MKLYCTCGILTGDVVIGVEIKKGVRKGSKLICAQCFERYTLADKMAGMARKQTKVDIPEFFKDAFGDKF
jgi:hypothetical protein